MNIAVHFHDKKQQNLHRELSYLYKIIGIDNPDREQELLIFLFVFISQTFLFLRKIAPFYPVKHVWLDFKKKEYSPKKFLSVM